MNLQLDRSSTQLRHRDSRRVLLKLVIGTASLAVIYATLLGEPDLSVAAEPSADENSGLTHSRAVEAVIWGMAAVNTDLMLQEMLTQTSGKVNQVIYWGGLLDWHNQTLTPNPDAIYFMAFFNTKDVGPIVFDIPPADVTASLTGNINTVWQTALEDVGLLGLDKGAGGKFVVVPPGYKGVIPDGYTVLRSDTFGGYALLRSTPKSHSDTDIAAAIAYGKRVKLYPLSAAAKPLETVFTDVKDVIYDSTIRYDASFFRSLDRVVQSEPWIERDRAMIDQLRTLGIEKGKPFAPDAAMQKVLTAAAADARKLLEQRYKAGWPSFFPNSQWRTPGLQEIVDGQSTTYADLDHYAVDARGLMYTYGFVGIKRLGTAQFYLLNIRDKDGKGYDGSQTYRMHVPANPPMEQYWSITAYDRQTHTLVRNMRRASRASNAIDVQKNSDGSIDVYFGPKAPAGKESNWVPTDPQRAFELLFRIYGPKKDFFDKAWVLPDVERVRSSALAATNQTAPTAVPVTENNFNLAESDMYFAQSIQLAGGMGKFHHTRDIMPIDHQTVIRANRDTLYSSAVFDLDASPVTVTLPDPGGRFMSMIAIDEEQYALQTVYAPGTYSYTKDGVGTRYLMLGLRTFVDPNDPKDLDKTHALQDAVKVDQKSTGTFQAPKWDAVTQKRTRDELIKRAALLPDTKGMFGPRSKVDSERHLIGTATGWGGNAPEDALYLTVVPAQNDGKTTYRLSVKGDVPVDGFWSISVYGPDGYFAKNDKNSYSVNNVTAKKEADGSINIQFGGCNGRMPNCIPITSGWNYWVRLYRPRADALTGRWKFPEARRIS